MNKEWSIASHYQANLEYSVYPRRFSPGGVTSRTPNLFWIRSCHSSRVVANFSFPFYLTYIWGRREKLISFPKIFVNSRNSVRFWTWVAEFDFLSVIVTLYACLHLNICPWIKWVIYLTRKIKAFADFIFSFANRLFHFHLFKLTYFLGKIRASILLLSGEGYWIE